MNYTIIFLAAILSVILYYILAEVIWQLRNRSFRRRLIIGVLTVALLASQIDFVNIFTKTGEETVEAAEADTESDTAITVMEITAFAEMPDDIREQTVPVGTALTELVLPDTLEAVCAAADADTDTENDADPADPDVGGYL